MKVYLGADHRGFKHKEMLKEHLLSRGIEVGDGGAVAYDPNDDYPDMAYRVARAVAAEPESRGVLLCGSGVGMNVVANKVRGVRATVGYAKDMIIHARKNDDINVISLPADTLSESQVIAFVNLFLSTPFSAGERYARRLAKISAIEQRSL